MESREFGCKLTGCLLGTLALFGFFSLLMNVMDGVGRSAQAKRQREDAAFDLPLLYGGLQTYMTTRGGRFPDVPDAAALKRALYPTYVPHEDVFTRFGDNAAFLPNPALSGKKATEFKQPETTVALYEPNVPMVARRGPNSRPTRAVLFLSGNLRRLDDGEWQAVRAANTLP